MSGLNKSSKVALEIFLTHTFCISSVKYYESGELILIKKEVFEKTFDPELLLLNIKKVLEKIEIDSYSVAETKLIFDNNYYVLVPDSLYRKGHEKTYLKFNTTIDSRDLTAVDNLTKLNINNIYLPFVNINNYLIEKFKKIEFYHFNTITINKLFENNSYNSLNCIIENFKLRLLVLKNGEVILFNSYEYKTLDDVLFYILLALNDKNYRRKNIKINIFSLDKVQEIKNKFSKFLENMTVKKVEDLYSFYSS